MRLPNFLIIGSSKSGTTTLYKYLCSHPQIFMSNPKEPQFFAMDERYEKGLEWYARLFEDASSSQVCGEASGRYTDFPKYPQAAARIAKHLPNVKLIYIMRHPVDRAYSHYVQTIKWNQKVATKPNLSEYRTTATTAKITETFEENITHDSRYLDISNYMLQIEQYLQFFSRESFLFLLMEDLIDNPINILKQICHFIGIDEEINLVEDDPIVANKASDHAQWFIRSRITAPLKSIPGMTRIASLLPQTVRDTAYNTLRLLPNRHQVEKDYLPQPMLPETRQMLLEKFREPNQKLESFLQRDLSHWQQ